MEGPAGTALVAKYEYMIAEMMESRSADGLPRTYTGDLAGAIDNEEGRTCGRS